jgi:2,4-dienoyl-CoA reductase-like NADH-dependent reductase (Old Yellow Enzyme family)
MLARQRPETFGLMTQSHSPDGMPLADVAAYYRRRSAAGIDPIVLNGTGVKRPASLNDPDVPRFHAAAELSDWHQVIDEVHAGRRRRGLPG